MNLTKKLQKPPDFGEIQNAFLMINYIEFKQGRLNLKTTESKEEYTDLVVTIRMVARNYKLLEESADAANRDLEHEAEMRLSDHLIRYDTMAIIGQVTKR